MITAEIIGGIAIFAFFWFVGAVRNRLRVPETPEGGLPALAFGGGIAAATLVLVANAATKPERFERKDGQIDPAVAATLNDVSSLIIGIAAPVALAIFVAATGDRLHRHARPSEVVGLAEPPAGTRVPDRVHQLHLLVAVRTCGCLWSACFSTCVRARRRSTAGPDSRARREATSPSPAVF